MDHVHWTWKGRRKFSTARTKEGAGDPPEGTKDSHQTGRGRQITHSTTSLFGALTRTTWWTRHQDNNNQRSCIHHAGKPTNTGEQRPGHNQFQIVVSQFYNIVDQTQLPQHVYYIAWAVKVCEKVLHASLQKSARTAFSRYQQSFR